MDARQINLTTHIDEIVALFEHENLGDVVLCGHSERFVISQGSPAPSAAVNPTSLLSHLSTSKSVCAPPGERVILCGGQ